MRVQTILSSGWTEAYICVPSVFFEAGWNYYLPQGINSVIFSVISFIIQGYTKLEILTQMEEEAEKLALYPFSLVDKQDAHNDWYEQLYIREQNCETILMRIGLTYPMTVQDMVQLLIDLGILLEVKHRDVIYLDFILRPFPQPQDILQLTTEEGYSSS